METNQEDGRVTERRNLVAVESEDNLEMEIEEGGGGGRGKKGRNEEELVQKLPVPTANAKHSKTHAQNVVRKSTNLALITGSYATTTFWVFYK
jgi:hypothetical protein